MLYPTKKLGEIIELKYGKGISKHNRKTNGKYLIYGANGELGRTDKYLVEGDAIIVGRKGSAGEVTRVSGKFWPSDVAYYVLGNEKVDIDYLFYLFKSLNLQRFAVGVKPGINRNRIYEIPIPLPPLEIQKKIVERIEKLMAKIDEAKKLRKEALADASALIPSALNKIFEEGKKKGWEEKAIGEISEKTKKIKPKDFFNKYFSYIDITSVSKSFGQAVRARSLPVDKAPSRARNLVKEMDIIFATTRPYLRKIITISKSLSGSIASTGFCIIRPNKKIVDPSYIYYAVDSEYFLSKIIPLQKGATYPAVSDNDVYNQKFPFPPLPEQQKIVKYLDSLSEKVRKIQTLQSASEKELKLLEKGILSEAFGG